MVTGCGSLSKGREDAEQKLETRISPFPRANLSNRAGVAELVDAQDLKSCALRGVRVRFPSPVPLSILSPAYLRSLPDKSI